jgi:CubicO group peptidase (beta-lactamase class C family)
MQKQFQKVVVLLLVFQAFTSCPAAQTSVGQPLSQLENVALEEMKAAGIPGAAIGIVSRGQVLFAKGFGVTSVEDGFPVTPTTLFRLGSTTKMFTAAALVQMALDGKLNLKRPIQDYVKGLDPAIAVVTTDQLLAHLSGLRNDDVTGNTSDEAALAREVKSWGPSRLFTAPGEVFSYSTAVFIWVRRHSHSEHTIRKYHRARP